MKLGIGARITAVFGLGALILSILMGGLSYFTVRHFLLAGRESAAQHQTFTNAVLVRNALQQGNTAYVSLLSNIDAGTDAHSVLFHGAKTYDSSLSVTAGSIPHDLRAVVLSGTAATQTYRTPGGTAEIVVGVPVPSVQAHYFDVFDLSDLDHTLRVLALALIVAGVITTILGTALGRFASTRSLRPLAVVSRAAGAIAGGELDTRLDAEAADPDLEGFTLSFNAMVDQLQERIEREARFNSDVSHELRSPLTTLAASVEVLEADRDDLPLRSQRALQLLSDDLRRFQRMVADLLEMSRADAGSVDVFLEEVRVGRAGAALGPGGLRPHGRPRRERTPRGAHRPGRASPGTSAWTSAASSGSWSTCWRTRPTTAAAPPRSASAWRPHDDSAGGDHGRRRRPGHRPPRAHQGVRPLLPRARSRAGAARGPGRGWASPSWPSTCGSCTGRSASSPLPRGAPASS